MTNIHPLGNEPNKGNPKDMYGSDCNIYVNINEYGDLDWDIEIKKFDG